MVSFCFYYLFLYTKLMNIQDASHELNKVLTKHFNTVDLPLRLELMNILQEYGISQYKTGYREGCEDFEP